MKTEVYCTVVLFAAVTTAWHLRPPRAAKKPKFDLNESPVKPGQEEKCKRDDGRDGICINEKFCTEDQVISVGGELDQSVVRVGTCPKSDDWCCISPNATQTDTVLKPRADDDCTLIPELGKECPLCVAIYREGGNPRASTTGRYCGGILIGKRVVLTAAGCIISASNREVWVKATASPTPERKYSVINRINHETYNSGTREHDLGLMILSEDVQWKAGIQKEMGACIGLQTSLVGNCVSVGFNEKDEIQLSKMTVKSGSCTTQGGVYDAACGTTEGNCRATYGSPILCPSDHGGFLVAGVVRQPCKEDKALLGAIMPSAKWLEVQLQSNGLKENNYRP